MQTGWNCKRSVWFEIGDRGKRVESLLPHSLHPWSICTQTLRSELSIDLILKKRRALRLTIIGLLALEESVFYDVLELTMLEQLFVSCHISAEIHYYQYWTVQHKQFQTSTFSIWVPLISLTFVTFQDARKLVTGNGDGDWGRLYHSVLHLYVQFVFAIKFHLNLSFICYLDDLEALEI